MDIKRLFFVVIVALVVGCKTPGKIISKNDAPQAISLNDEEVNEEPKVYRESRARVVDILDTKLEIKPDWSKQYLYGKAIITFKPYFYGTDSLVLDAKGFDIGEVSMLGRDGIHHNVTFTYDSTKMHIFLGNMFHKEDTLQVFIAYTAKPNEVKNQKGSMAISDAKGLYFINADGKDASKPKQIWTQGETESNSCWFPTIDAPNERMTQEMAITVDTEYVTLANGLLISIKINGDGTRTDVWKQSLPAAPYLTMFAVGKFSIIKDRWRNIEVNYYVEHDYERYAKDIFGHTPAMLEFFSMMLGVDYPWEKFSQIVCRDYVSGAMENTTCVLHGEYLQRTRRELLDETNEDVISHELFHHWFGDLVTCESWSNIPLNESFATYGEYLWNEHKYGRDYADQKFAYTLSTYLLMSRQKDPDVIRYNYKDKEDMFDGISYQKGGRILHMLRKVVGDEAFFTSLKLYLTTNKFSSVEIHNLRLAFEQVTGQDLHWFFDEWFMNHGHPDLNITYKYSEEKKRETIIVEQQQDTKEVPLYKMPIKVDIYVNGTILHKEILMQKRIEQFTFDVAMKPDLVNFDAEKMLLCTKDDGHNKAEWDFLFRHGALYLDRLEGLNKLLKSTDHNGDSTVSSAIMTALQDMNSNIRNIAVKNIDRTFNDAQDSTKKFIMKQKLVAMLKTELKASVRKEIVKALQKNFMDSTLYDVYRNMALTDSSYDVEATALETLFEMNKKMGISLAHSMEKDSASKIILEVANILAEHGDNSDNAFFQKVFKMKKGSLRSQIISEYAKFLSHCEDSAIRSGVVMIEDVARHGSPWWVKLTAMHALTTISDIYDDRMHGKGLVKAGDAEAKKSTAESSNIQVDAKTSEKYKKLKDDLDSLMTQIKKEETDKNLVDIWGK